MSLPHWHFTMLNDRERNQFYRSAIDYNFKDKIVVEVGCGIGILSLFALQAGAKYVYAIEKNPRLAKQAGLFLSRNYDGTNYKIINKQSFDVSKDDIPDECDILLLETFGSDPFCEGIIPIVNDAKRFLKDDYQIVPEQIAFVISPLNIIKAPKIEFNEIDFSDFNENICEFFPDKIQTSDAGNLILTPFISIRSICELGSAVLKVQAAELKGVNLFDISFLLKHGKEELLAARADSVLEQHHWMWQRHYRKNDGDSLMLKITNKISLL